MTTTRCAACGAELRLAPARCPLCGAEPQMAAPAKRDVDAYHEKVRILRDELKRARHDLEAV